MTNCGNCKYWHEYKYLYPKLRKAFGRIGICKNRKSENYKSLKNPLYKMCGDHEVHYMQCVMDTKGKGIKE